MRLLTILLGLLLATLPAAAQTSPTITDGDTLRLNGTTWRLHGIDAPEMNQVCADGWRGGVAAKEALSRIVAGAKVECQEVTKDRYGRTVGTCRANGEDVGTAMVRQGMAVAYVNYSWRYLPEEWLAWWDGLGVHARNCEKPWEWRASTPRR